MLVPASTPTISPAYVPVRISARSNVAGAKVTDTSSLVTHQSLTNAKHRSASYVNYDLLASEDNVYGIFGYGMRAGSGVAQVNVLARAVGEYRGLMLAGAAWQYHSDATGNTFTIGDAESLRGKYEDSVRFDGVQYTSQNLTYDVGWERTDFGDSAMHLGSFVTEATATKPLTPQLTGEAHFYSDASTAMLGLGAIWNTPRTGQLHFGLAPTTSKGVTGFFSYTFTSPRVNLTLEDRVWSASSNLAAGTFPEDNYRQLQGTLQYKTSSTTAIRLQYGTQAQSGFAARSMILGFVQKLNDADLHIDFASTAAGSFHNAGLTSYFSLPLGNGRSITSQNMLLNGAASNNVTVKQNLPESGVGTSYALRFDGSGTSFADATVSTQTSGSSSKFELSRVAGQVAWNSELSGSVFFFGGTPVRVNQTIDQSSAFDALRGRGAATLRIVSETGTPLPTGLIVRALNDDGEWRVTQDGRVELSDIATGPQTLIVASRQVTCVVATVVPPAINGKADLGTQVCR
jgi:hypothetical protein